LEEGVLYWGRKGGILYIVRQEVWSLFDFEECPDWKVLA
jgi:hypothetical protein